MKFQNKSVWLFATLLCLLSGGCKDTNGQNKVQDEETKKPPSIPPHEDPPAAATCTSDHEDVENAISINSLSFSSSETVCDQGAVGYSLKVEDKTKYTITLSFAEGYDLDLYLFDDSDDDEPIASSYYYNPEQLEYTLPEGQYYIYVYGYDVSSNSGAPFDLKVEGTPTCVSDDECDENQYCNMFAGDVCTEKCTKNSDCVYIDLACIPATGECSWGECLSDNDCTIFGDNAPLCVIEKDETNFAIQRYCAAITENTHCAADDDPFENVATQQNNNDDFHTPYVINISANTEVKLNKAKVCNSDNGDFYHIIPDSKVGKALDITVNVKGSDSIYLVGGLFDVTSGRLLDGGSFDVQDWDSCHYGTLSANCADGSCDTKEYHCDLDITYRALKFPSDHELIFALSRFQLYLYYYSTNQLSADITTMATDEASNYQLTIMAESTKDCDSNAQCADLAYPRTRCDISCQMDEEYQAYGSNLSQPCLSYLDCNIRNDFSLVCSRTEGNPANNFCTSNCSSATDCAELHGGLASDFTCVGKTCYKTACETAADCPYNDKYHQYCLNGKCVECTSDSECVNDSGYTYCSEQYHTCSTCLTDDQCSNNNDGHKCTLAPIDDPYYYCGCSMDSDCSLTPNIRCIFYSGLEVGTCGCTSDEDCIDGYKCGTVSGQCYKKS